MALAMTALASGAEMRRIGMFTLLRREGTLELSPPFQRGSVWSVTQQVRFIETLLDGLPVPPIFIQWGDALEAWGDKTIVIDGKQRLTAMFAFMDGDLEVRGERYPDQSELFQREWRNTPIPVSTCTFQHEWECAALYVRLLTTGTAHTDEEIARAQAWLEEQKKK